MYSIDTDGAQSLSKITQGASTTSWSSKYGQRHRLRWITEFPAGITPPSKVRIYARNGHFLIQWWDPGEKTNLCRRINGDLIDAIAAARAVESRLQSLRKSGQRPRRLSHEDLIKRFLDDLGQRADAGEIAPGTVDRYGAALAHYLAFVESPGLKKKYPHPTLADRSFALEFASFLANRQVAPNGHDNGARRPLRGQRFILDAVRAVYEWADDPDRGDCMPSGFRNPFRKGVLDRRSTAADPLAPPDITGEMATAFMEACDSYQLRLFAPMLICGLRAAEPVFLFAENLTDGWLRVGSIPQLAYMTKGRRDKRLPLLDEIAQLWGVPNRSPVGLLLVRRAVYEGRESPPLSGASINDLAQEFDRRRHRFAASTAKQKQRIRDAVMRDAGALNYDQINLEFRRMTRMLGWPASATLKDFRHLFATQMAAAGLAEHERRYLLGHAPDRDSISTYTHLCGLETHYRNAVERSWPEILEIIRAANRDSIHQATAVALCD